jgi:hypothetical protein
LVMQLPVMMAHLMCPAVCFRRMLLTSVSGWSATALMLDGWDSGLRLGFLLSDLLCSVNENGKQWVSMMVKGAEEQHDDCGKVGILLCLFVYKSISSRQCHVEE